MYGVDIKDKIFSALQAYRGVLEEEISMVNPSDLNKINRVVKNHHDGIYEEYYLLNELLFTAKISFTDYGISFKIIKPEKS